MYDRDSDSFTNQYGVAVEKPPRGTRIRLLGFEVDKNERTEDRDGIFDYDDRGYFLWFRDPKTGEIVTKRDDLGYKLWNEDRIEIIELPKTGRVRLRHKHGLSSK